MYNKILPSVKNNNNNNDNNKNFKITSKNIQAYFDLGVYIFTYQTIRVPSLS